MAGVKTVYNVNNVDTIWAKLTEEKETYLDLGTDQFRHHASEEVWDMIIGGLIEVHKAHALNDAILIVAGMNPKLNALMTPYNFATDSGMAPANKIREVMGKDLDETGVAQLQDIAKALVEQLGVFTIDGPNILRGGSKRKQRSRKITRRNRTKRLYKKRRNTKRKNTKRKNTKRKNTKRRNTKKRNNKRRV